MTNEQLLTLIEEYGELRERIGQLVADDVSAFRRKEAELLDKIRALVETADQGLSAAEATVRFRAGHRGNADRVQNSTGRRQGHCPDDDLV